MKIIPFIIGLTVFLVFGILGAFMIGIGVYAIWEPARIDYDNHKVGNCNVTSWEIVELEYEDEDGNDYISYLPTFYVSYHIIENNLTGYDVLAYESNPPNYYGSRSSAYDIITKYSYIDNILCYIKSDKSPIYFIYDIDNIRTMVNNLNIASYVIFGISGLGLLTMVLNAIITTECWSSCYYHKPTCPKPKRPNCPKPSFHWLQKLKCKKDNIKVQDKTIVDINKLTGKEYEDALVDGNINKV
ncbi:Transmembrane domain-containing protein [Orpheovirus IHUMI-LCC2]|uniref:Transmembrane domain-containing protein n=1 Tax=Orpheovirus IHUMI-LCC2 TaxID=2023057 RepID=A0A2I2L4A9_9VIRU|nr:Transmembrane domain-containing protein [Orpheovirus IHUMI-LCC2]SNW62340.1 Transmembrane domain-containing protein [Orpheovirus IHUMI-LCC2]